MIDERDVREMLHRRADAIPASPSDPSGAVTRAERRVLWTAISTGAIVIALSVSAIAGASAVRGRSLPADQPTSAPVASGALAYALDGDIYLADPDGSRAVKIADASAGAGCQGITEYSSPSWSPNGRYLAFQRDCSSSQHRVMVVTDPHGNAVGEFPTYGWGVTWSPDSTRLAVWEPAMTVGVYGVDGERQASLPEPTLTGGGNDAAPGWMPDGSALLLYGYAVMPLDGSAVHELSPGRNYSPDGTRYAVDMGHSFAIYDADGSLVSEASVRPDPHDPGVEAWSPDGGRLTSLSKGELNVIDVASGTVTVLTEARAALDGGDEILGVSGFSPQGDRILYETGDGTGLATAALWSIGIDGSDARLVVAGTTQGAWRSR